MSAETLIEGLERVARADIWVPKMDLVHGIRVSVESAECKSAFTYAMRKPGGTWETVSRRVLVAELTAADVLAKRDDAIAQRDAANLAADQARNTIEDLVARLQATESWLTEWAHAGNARAATCARKNRGAVRRAAATLRSLDPL